MAVRLAVRHLPAGSTSDSLSQLLEQAGVNVKQDQVRVQRVFPGKVETKIKSQVPATAYMEVPSSTAALRMCRILEAQGLKCERAFAQHLPVRTLSSSAKLPLADSVQFGTWKDDPEYARFEASLNPKPKSSDEGNKPVPNGAPAGPKPEVVPALVEHFRKQMIARRARSQKQQKKDGKKRRPEDGSDTNATKAEKTSRTPQQKKRQGAPRPPASGDNPQPQQQKKKAPQQQQGGRPPKGKPEGAKADMSG